jgi:hypothetical protein
MPKSATAVDPMACDARALRVGDGDQSFDPIGRGKNQSYSSETSVWNLREIASNYTSFWEIPLPLNPSKSQYSEEFQAFCKADSLMPSCAHNESQDKRSSACAR